MVKGYPPGQLNDMATILSLTVSIYKIHNFSTIFIQYSHLPVILLRDDSHEIAPEDNTQENMIKNAI